MKRTTGIRMTAWLGILAVCLAVFMPGVNALKNRYQSSSTDIFTADICYGAQAIDSRAAVLTGLAAQDYQDANHGVAPADKARADVPLGHASHASNASSYTSPEAQAGALATLSDRGAPASSGHSADHAVECLYCGFFTHHLPLLHSAPLPAMPYGFVSRIAPQHQHASYYARPAFVPLSRAPPRLS